MKHALLISLAFIMILAGCNGGNMNSANNGDLADNPLLADFETPFGVPPFDEIKTEHYLPAMKAAMAEHKEEIDAIVDSKETPTFENTMAPLLNSGKTLGKVSAVFYSQLSANGDDEMLRVQTELAPLMAAHSDDIQFNEELFAKVKAVYENRENEDLTPEQLYLLEREYKSFVRNGANLDAEQKETLAEINQKLAAARAKFSENLLAENRSFQLVIEDEEDLEGLPEGVIAAAASEAKAADMEGKWIFTTDKPSMLPFLTYSPRREFRAELYDAYTHRGDKDNEHDNKEVLAEIVNLRVRKAKLLGYEHYANYVLESRMAKNAEGVMELLDKLWTPALDLAKEEAKELQKLINDEGGNFKLTPSDWWYYAEKLRIAKYDLDDNELRPYFKLQNVIDGSFYVANQLYGLTFHPIKDIPLPHEEALAYEVKEADGSHLGVLYLDYHPRKGKRVGAWCGRYRGVSYENGERIPPVVTIVCNFTRPSSDKPALLSLDEVETLFHEFGHGLDSLLAQNTYRTTDVARDFVELPSQIMEHWAMEPAVLKEYAKHYETGEVIPDSLIAKIEASSLFNQGFINVEFLAACLLDMAYHTITEEQDFDIDKFEEEALNEVGLIPEILSRYRSTYFAHITGGYAAGYYSYIWSGVLDNDAFAAFEETSLFDQEVATAFRKNVLEKNGTGDAAELYRAFRGRDPKIDALLRNRGLN